MDDDLTRELALEEHLQGKPYGGDSLHCDGCRAAVLAEQQRNCSHDNVEEIRVVEFVEPVSTICVDCGWRSR
jgi:hypothetical protein